VDEHECENHGQACQRPLLLRPSRTIPWTLPDSGSRAVWIFDFGDAVVVLGYHTGGTAYWNYVYAFSLESNSPKLIGWFRAGSRADFGLYRVEVTNGGLVVDLFDPEHRAADCCSEGFVRTRYKFKNGYFVQTGPLEFGKIEDSAPKTK
jgi:hypothetical protein